MIRSDGSRSGGLAAGPDVSIESRLPFVMVAIVLVFALFGVRLFQLQILHGEELSGKSTANHVRLVRLEAPRGDILDREGRVLATARPAFGVTVMPSDLRARSEARRRLPTPRKIASPTLCPIVSLISLKWSRSRVTTANFVEFPAVLRAWSLSVTRKRVRLGRPVSVS